VGLTLVGALAVTVIMQYQSLVPEHKRNARKIKAVETAILDMLHGSGHTISPEMSDYAVECWNKAVMTISQGVK
jgi:predicted TIM-barrel enzyme